MPDLAIAFESNVVIADSVSYPNLLANMTAYWSLDEASGQRNDSHTNALHLTDNNTVGSTTGKVSNAASFIGANSESLSHVYDALLANADVDFCFSAWYRASATSDVRTVIGMDWSVVEYQLRISFGVHSWLVTTSGGFKEVTVAGASADTWYHAFVWHDAANNQVGISVNNAAPVTATTNGESPSANGADRFSLGARGTWTQFLTGEVDEVTFWKGYIPSADERTWVYNSGNGRTYAEYS